VNAVYFALDDYFPDAFSHFLRRNFEMTVASQSQVQMISILLLFFTASGIFEPLKVELNRSWNCSRNRHYFKNQLVGLGLIFACGALMVISTMLTALSNGSLPQHSYASAGILGVVFFRLAAIPLSMFLLLLVYWLLPNCKVRAADIVPAAIGVGFLLEILKYINLFT
jgi:membrane protein